MGRIKTQFIKRLGKELAQKHKDKLKQDFEENKKIVEQLLTNPSKKIRNVVAGYVTRLMKQAE
ncbi:30S ribosomal protein S17e [Candidatus Woesearchaeota archaeon]|nr:MAG: 30S ribosomal protein S17e [Candidatus Woesearchaeota archaeon]